MTRSLPKSMVAPPLGEIVERQLVELRAVAGPDADRWLNDGSLVRRLRAVWAASDFVATNCLREPQLIEELANGEVSARRAGDWARLLDARTNGAVDAADFSRRLRRTRRREMSRIAWRDLTGTATLDDSLAELSDFADASITAALAYAREELIPRFGEPRGSHDDVQELIVLAMGKLGGRELNFSSDIDLVFLYPGAGRTDGPRSLSSEEFFSRLCQRLIHYLDAVTEDGLVFRVDTRLRPFGASGPLAMSLGAFEMYLQQHGRDWERYAYVKARPVTGAAEQDALFQSILRPFVYRRYLDYGVFGSLRRMKELIERESSRRDLSDDIKSGPGGIREIEFIAQTFQLIRGGRDPGLRARGLLEVLPKIERQQLIGPHVATELEAAYRYLRSVENRLQAMHDRQTHALPRSPLERSRLASAMGYADWEGFANELEQHRTCVARHFARTLFGPPEASRGAGLESQLAGTWDGSAERGEAALARAGIENVREIQESLVRLKQSGFYRRMDETSRERLDALIPNLLLAVGRLEHQVLAWRRLERIVEAVARRSAYLALLNENPLVLGRLAGLCAQSGFVARQVASYPLLLDELLDPRIFDSPPTRAQFSADLDIRLARAEADGLEQQLEALGRFQRAAMFRVAMADLGETLPLMKISDRLTDIAELTLEHALKLAWTELVARHGRPMCDSNVKRRTVGFAIVGYGKLGGLELGYASDLDLVFVHDSNDLEARTDGAKSLDNAVFFARLGRRIIHLLGTPTRSGILYQVDMRLRPSGNSGLLVTSVDSFRRYQQERAWTWEHQALARSRTVAGDADVRSAFEVVRREILRGHVDRTRLAQRVPQMRERMRKQLGRGGTGRFDIKQDHGGLADLEFLVQYWVLSGAHGEPALVEYSDNIRQLEALACAHCIGKATARRLTDIYLTYRRRLHRIALDDADELVTDDEFLTERAYVRRVWEVSLETGSKGK
nr:bifunctional [glutamate--ammonia ligase]-adenylyl-L-tyrosine phosphorylase/[glutamate--ammonia-ligase] adenylyltransferase [Gammaproteobacteria bacterium]